MSVLVIDTDPTALFWSQTTTLEGVPYLLTFRYNSRESVYYLQIQSADASVTYAQGIKIVPNYFLLRGIGPLPPGELIAMSTSSDLSPPQLGELGNGLRVVLMYIESTDLFAGVPPGDSWRNPDPTGI